MHTHAGRRLAACSMNRVQAIMYDLAYQPNTAVLCVESLRRIQSIHHCVCVNTAPVECVHLLVI